jgi:hypothetical protein
MNKDTTTPEKTSVQTTSDEGLDGAACCARDVLSRLNAHIAMMAPHQMQRQGGILMIEARDNLRMLCDINEADCEMDTEARAEAHKYLGDWVWGDNYGVPSLSDIICKMGDLIQHNV